MALDSLDQLCTAFCQASKAQDRAQLAVKLRQALQHGTAVGKENGAGGAKAFRTSAMQAFKAVQQQLSTQPCSGKPEEREELVRLGQASLAVLSTTAAATQLSALRYNFVRRLVSLKAYVPALEESLLLHSQLCAQHGGGAHLLPPAQGKADLPAEVVGLVVGTVLTLVLCCVEGQQLGSAALDTVLQAAHDLPAWLSLLPTDEAAKHGDAVYRSLYRGAVGLLETGDWPRLEAVACALVAAAAADAVQAKRAMQAVAKFLAHLPSSQATSLLAAVVAEGVPAAAAEDLLSLLCSALQHLQPSKAGAFWQAVEKASSSEHAVLRQAALLLPALASAEADASSQGSQHSLRQLHAALSTVEASVEAVEQQLVGAQQTFSHMQQHLILLSAAFQAANALRRLLAGDKSSSSKGAADSLLAGAGRAMMLAAASVLELLACIVGVSTRAAELPGAEPLPISGQGHAAAVGLVTAARLRALAAQDPAARSSDDSHSNKTTACSRLLGWDLTAFSQDGVLPPASGPVQQHELAWLASALFNVGVDLHAAGHYGAAERPFRDALTAAACCLPGVAAEEAAPRLQDFCRRSTALADSQQRAGKGCAALATLGHCLALLACLGSDITEAGRPVVTAFVRLKAEVLLRVGEEQRQAPARAPAANKGKGRGRTAAQRSKAATPDAATHGERQLHDISLPYIMQQHAAALASTSAVLAVAELELQACNAQGSHPELGAVSVAESRRLAESLLTELWPAGSEPVSHARLLVLLFELGMPAGGSSGLQLLERAVHLLHKATAPEAPATLAHAQALLALATAQRLVQEALLQQRQQQRRESHAAASTSTGNSEDVPEAGEQALPSFDRQAWARVWQTAEQALQHLHHAGAGLLPLRVQQTAEQLQQMLGLQGRQGDGLLTCLLPGSEGELGDASAFQAAAVKLAATPARGLASTLQRGMLHRQAAEHLAAGGRIMEALYEASEAHRLASGVFHAEGQEEAAEPIWWELASTYAASLMQLGQLFELAGLPDEASQALKEGHRLAVSVGSHLLAASFSIRLASIHCNKGQQGRAQRAAEAAASELAAAEHSLPFAAQLCGAELAAVQAQLALSGGEVKEALKHAHAAAAEANKLATQAEGSAAAHAAALHARALLQHAECLAAQGDPSGAQAQAEAALAALHQAPGSSRTPYCQAAVLLFLAQGQAAAPPSTSLTVWGLAPSSATAQAQTAQPAKPAGRSSRQGSRTATARQRSKAAAQPADQEIEADRSSTCAMTERVQRLWQAFALSQELPVLNRRAAVQLAEACGQQGYLQLAALLLHLSLGAAMRLQYCLVLHTKAQQAAQRQRRGLGPAGAGAGAAEQGQTLRELAALLEHGLDWHVVQQLANASGAGAAAAGAAAPAARGRKSASASRSAPAPASRPEHLLAALNSQAEQALRRWLQAMPANTAVCAMGASLATNSIMVCRLVPCRSHPLIVSLPAQPLSASLSQHPIRALSMDDEPSSSIETGSKASCGGVQSVLDEMDAVLQGSTRSMQELATDTREQQREWWRARLALDDRLAALLKHLGSSWLGPWRCLLVGLLSEQRAAQQLQEAADRGAQQLLEAVGGHSSGAQGELQGSVLQEAVAALLLGARAGLEVAELEAAIRQLGAAICPGSLAVADIKALAAQLAEVSRDCDQAGEAALPDTAPVAAAVAGGVARARKAAGKSVKFADQQDGAEAELAAIDAESAAAVKPAARRSRQTAGRGKKDAAAAGAGALQGRRAASTRMEVAGEQQEQDEQSPAPVQALNSSSSEPPQTAVRGTDLCRVFDAMSLGEGDDPTAEPAGTQAAATQQQPATGKPASKHRSRLGMMQAAATPGRPATGRKPAATTAAAAAAAAATAPRAPRPLPLSAVKTAPPPGRSSGGGGREEGGVDAAAASLGPVLMVLDGALQALPWESVSGLRQQRLYRCPSLPCAAASAQRRVQPFADLGHTYYALNPSGDLAATQGAFQDWFARLRGWEGTAGRAPSTAELAAALSTREFFVYLGHGGGDQYLPPSRLRALDRCAASLLMGCSSGRLRAAAHYDCSGPVLAYLLAGCPTAVANLWDVTDKDIDRFSQALLTQWLSGRGGSSQQQRQQQGDTGGGGPAEHDASAAVAQARGVCKLPHLIGAAPVCYGIPTAVTFSA